MCPGKRFLCISIEAALTAQGIVGLTNLAFSQGAGLFRHIAAATLKWLWVKNRVTPKWNPSKWKHGQKLVVFWQFNFDPYPNESLQGGSGYLDPVGFSRFTGTPQVLVRLVFISTGHCHSSEMSSGE